VNNSVRGNELAADFAGRHRILRTRRGDIRGREESVDDGNGSARILIMLSSIGELRLGLVQHGDDILRWLLTT
jgi:hypothetical protein